MGTQGEIGVGRNRTRHEIKFETSYCFDIAIKVELYDSVNERQRKVMRNMTSEYS